MSGKLYPVILIGHNGLVNYDQEVYFLCAVDAAEYGQPNNTLESLDLELAAEHLEDGQEITFRRETWTRAQLDDVDWGDNG